MTDTSLLPYNATAQERALELATARLADTPVLVREVWNPDTCPVELLPWLAWAFSVDRWEANWTEEQKRAVIRNSIFVHRHKGTLGAVKRALVSLGYTAIVTEWFDKAPTGTPGTFSIEVEVPGPGISEALYAQLERVIADAKNVRSHMDAIQLTGVVSGAIYTGAATISGESTSVFPA